MTLLLERVTNILQNKLGRAECAYAAAHLETSTASTTSKPGQEVRFNPRMWPFFQGTVAARVS